MAIPDTLNAWRAFVAQAPLTPPEAPVRKRTLSSTEQDDYNAARIAWLSVDVVLETQDVIGLRRLSAIVRAEAATQRATSPRTMAISGPAASGKTTAALWIARDHERSIRRRLDVAGSEIQPSLYVVVPPATTPKTLMTAFCNCLGLPHTRAQTAQDLTESIVHVLRQLGTSLVVLDEVHNVQSNRQTGAEAASTLKLFMERLDAAFILAGIDLERSPVFAGVVGEQLRARTSLHRMKGFPMKTTQNSEWEAFLDVLADLIPLRTSPRAVLRRESRTLLEISGGSIGRIRAIVRRAAIDAILTGAEAITADSLHIACGGDEQIYPPQIATRERRQASA